ncbi:hypothetical protein DFR95_003988 [Clostridium beijerinckii]|nr:hypothetical protein [Clostridium beijerinckii]
MPEIKKTIQYKLYNYLFRDELKKYKNIEEFRKFQYV